MNNLSRSTWSGPSAANRIEPEVRRAPRPLGLLSLLLTLSLLAVSCSTTTTVSNTEGPTTTEDVTRTIPEEMTTSTARPTTSTSIDLGPLPDPIWADEPLVLQPIVELIEPIAIAHRSGDDDIWIAEREGRIRRVRRRLENNGRLETIELMNTVALDIRSEISTQGEGGLLGFDFSTDGKLIYVSYTNTDGNSVIAEYRIGPTVTEPSSKRILLEVDQPFTNHNGGQITIGPDGYLYVAFGDGGSGGDPERNGQDRTTLLGSILRIDPTIPGEDLPYTIPAGNPFVEDEPYLPEIWLWGVRNPWRFSFDLDGGDLWIADVGQNEIEEVNYLQNSRQFPAGRGANLGWRILEGDEFFDGDTLPADYVPPIFTYPNGSGRCSVTGGYVYRGDYVPNLQGVYLFGDYCSGEVFAIERLEDGRAIVGQLTFDEQLSELVSFGQTADGEIYVMERSGMVWRIQPPGLRRPTTERISDGNRVDDTADAEADDENS